VEPDDLDTIMHAAEGRLDALVDATQSEIWDRAPVVVIVEEAGGWYRDRNGGKDVDLPGGLFTNGRIDDQLDDLLTT
jgi:fructose-1,6-bisphosphatase/inositol monophosphatase family enzyme